MTDNNSNRYNSNSPITIEVCHGPRCCDYGGKQLAKQLTNLGIAYIEGDCRSLCPYSPTVHVNERFIPRATVEKIIMIGETTKSA